MAKVFRFTIVFFRVSLITYAAYLAWSLAYRVAAEQQPFSSEAWKEKASVYAQSNDPACVRGGMALDIVASKLLQGRAIAEVKSLLGGPDSIKDGLFNYELGQCSGLGWHNSILQISFLNNQQVDSAAIVAY